MKLSENWLAEWVSPTVNGEKIATMLTIAGLEVDSRYPVAGPFSGVIVAKVLSCQAHPQADKLSLCEVDNGRGQVLKIVCGASNVFAGMKVALAQIGAQLPGDFVIKEAKLRGELSQGMLCSQTELGLSETSEGIMELDEEAPLGEDLREYLSLDDHVLDIELTPNRGDCLSVLGIAREVSALTQTPLKALAPIEIARAIDEKKNIQVLAEEACPAYYGRIIQNIDPKAKTPLWMRERLRRAGLRPIHPVVDVSNYVMLELGQPLHAFDLQKLEGDIQVRFAKPNETLTLLDGQLTTLKDKVLVIADENKALAMAGVMGGLESAVDENTCHIFLESAYFEPKAIAGVARKHGLFTDSAQRFERGVDPQVQKLALERASALILEIASGKAGPITESLSKSAMPKTATIAFNPLKVKQITGMDFSEDRMKAILESLNLSVCSDASPWKVRVPSYRFDLQLDVDLIEEIIRLHGYDKIPSEKMTAQVSSGSIDDFESLGLRASRFFANRAYHETISYSFVDPEIQGIVCPEVPSLKLLNPISPELAEMRVSLFPGLIASMLYNCHRQQSSIKFFEQGVIFENNAGAISEHPCIGGLLMGEHAALNWSEASRPFDFFDLKGDLQALFASLGLLNYAFEKCENAALHPGKSAQIRIHNEVAGSIGVLHPKIADALGLLDEAIIFELKLKPLLSKNVPHYKAISKFPHIRRDLSLLADETLPVAEIEALLRDTVPLEWLKSFDVFDVYKGEGVPEGKKSLAIALTLQDDKRTLVDTEINALMSAIIKKLTDNFAINLRE